MKKGKTAAEISEAVEEAPEIVNELYQLITDNPEKDEEELLEFRNHPSHKE